MFRFLSQSKATKTGKNRKNLDFQNPVFPLAGPKNMLKNII